MKFVNGFKLVYEKIEHDEDGKVVRKLFAAKSTVPSREDEEINFGDVDWTNVKLVYVKDGKFYASETVLPEGKELRFADKAGNVIVGEKEDETVDGAAEPTGGVEPTGTTEPTGTEEPTGDVEPTKDTSADTAADGTESA